MEIELAAQEADLYNANKVFIKGPHPSATYSSAALQPIFREMFGIGRQVFRAAAIFVKQVLDYITAGFGWFRVRRHPVGAQCAPGHTVSRTSSTFARSRKALSSAFDIRNDNVFCLHTENVSNFLILQDTTERYSYCCAS